MKIKLLSILLILISLGCQPNSKTNDTEKAVTSTNENSLNFEKTDFADRPEELKYIREYLKYKLPTILVSEYPEKMRKAQLELVASGKDVSLEAATEYTLQYSNNYEWLISYFNDNNISFKEAKWSLDNYSEWKEKRKRKAETEKINNIIPQLKKKTLMSIKDTRKNDFIKSGDDYLTVANYYDEYYPSSPVKYKIKQLDNNIYEISVLPNEESFSPINIFHYYLDDNYFRHIK